MTTDADRRLGHLADPGTDEVHSDRTYRRDRVLGRKGVDQRLDALVAEQQLVVGHTTQLLSLLQSGVQNEVMETATRTIGPAGVLERRFMAPFAGVAVINPTLNLITVQEGAAGALAQGDGPGSFLAPPYSLVVMPLAGRFVNFYGAAGTRFSYTILTRRPEPSGGGGVGGTAALNEIDTSLESSTPLAGNATFAGTTLAVAEFARLRGFASSDVAGTLAIQQARLAGGPWYTTTSQPVAAGATTGTVVESILTLPYARVFYTNGAAAQASFELDSALVAI